MNNERTKSHKVCCEALKLKFIIGIFFRKQYLFLNFNPVNAKKINTKNVWKYILGGSTSVGQFFIFCQGFTQSKGCPGYVLEFLWIMLKFSIQAQHNISDGALFDKNR